MNKKSTQERAEILHFLVEGNSLRSASRIAGVSLNTVSKLLVEAGEACLEYQDKTFRNLSCKRIQCDEIWSFCCVKEKNIPKPHNGQLGYGDVWTWTGIDVDTKLMVSWMVGWRDLESLRMLIDDLAGRLNSRVQLTSDGHKAYLLQAIEDSDSFGCEIDYTVLHKLYGNTTEAGRYSSAQEIGNEKKTETGNLDMKHLSTSYVECQNLTIRTTNRRFTRLTNILPKKIENHIHMLALHFMHYNFVRIHKTLRMTPAMEAKVTDYIWTLEDVIQMMERYVAEKSN